MSKHREYMTLFKDGIIRGIGWSIGVTIGFAIVSTILLTVIQFGGGLPIIGNTIAAIVEATQISLSLRSR